jgi:antitoxin component YwqK of YwqJK toxin-antitoxin module
MKNMLSICFLLIICRDYSSGQKIDTIYYDKNWKETGNKSYQFYRIASESNGIVKVTDYYKSGKIQMSGTYNSFAFDARKGVFIYYKKDGHINYKVIYEPINNSELLSPYTNYLNLISPLTKSYHVAIEYRNNGSIWGIGYVSDSCSCISRFLYMSNKGKLWFQMSFLYKTPDGPHIDYIKNKVYITGQYKRGKRIGEWVFYNRDGSVIKRKSYDNGKLLR